jgi:hypothetical protein
MFSSSFTISEQEHRQRTPYKHAAPDSVLAINQIGPRCWLGLAAMRQKQLRWIASDAGSLEDAGPLERRGGQKNFGLATRT